MVKVIAFDIAVELIIKLSSRALSQIGLWWNLKHDLDDLKSTVSTIKTGLLDAEERSVTSHLVKDWLDKLKDILYDADDLLNDFSTEALRKDLMGGNKLTKRYAFSYQAQTRFGGLAKTALAQFVYNDKMVHDHFELKLWLCVSDVFYVKVIVENTIKSATGQALDLNLDMDQLQKQLQDKIDGKSGVKGSRIIVTTSSSRVAKITNSTNLAFVEIEKQILERYGRVPLVIRMKASILSYKETEKEWSSFKDDEFVKISQKEGLVKQLSLSQSLEDIGSFFQELKEHRIWGMTCQMHDLMHDLAESVTWMENNIVGSNKIASEGNNLRALLHFPNIRIENLSDETWDLIFANYRCLRVLELDDLNFEKILHSIYKLKHLRYLDVSDNPNLKILPKNICKIQNLQALKLDWCGGLEELPKKIEKLVNLTHLACCGCSSITHMPHGIGKLSSLETLSMFVVDKDGSLGDADLRELKKFKAVNLKEKQHLRSLVLQWVGDLQPHPNLNELCIEGWRGYSKFPSWLSLPTNLVDIRIFGPSKFKHLPAFAQLPCLQRLEIYILTELEYMNDNSPNGSQGEPQSFFLSLKKAFFTSSCFKYQSRLTIIDKRTLTEFNLATRANHPSLDDKLKLVNTSSRPLKHTMKMNITSRTPSSSTSSLPHSKLKYFHVDNIEGLDTHMLDEYLQHFTGLKKLTIGDCNEVDLEGVQWEPLSFGVRLQHLVQLKRLEINNCNGLKSLFPVFQHLTSLQAYVLQHVIKLHALQPQNVTAAWLANFQYLEVLHCRRLTEWLQHLTNLRSLFLIDLPNLTSLPDEMRCLTSLEYLQIDENPQLEERCRGDLWWLPQSLLPDMCVGIVDFPNISHTSNPSAY
ncbi:hypothetical protein ERO13_A11G279250v2 [Gossypium hirsutum]|nr:hypothetical protein ERO13_A11G279250v2 [Gossypium hirsutum]